ncbi:MAG: hypothetical protein JHC31_02775 [Sulfurihydrogenibium sp.]|jgi:hypothetical protein|nr:hypothetical protein [Sulfurihydrogenibium sp.]
MKKLYVKERDNGLNITVDNNGRKETTDIDDSKGESFSTKLSDCCEVEIKHIEPLWNEEYYLEDMKYYSLDPTPFSEAVIYMDNEYLIIEDDGNFLYGHEDKAKVSIDTTKHNILQIIVGYKTYYYRGFEILFKKVGITPSNDEEKSYTSFPCDILSEEKEWKKKLKLSFEDDYIKFTFPKRTIFDCLELKKYTEDGWLEFKLGEYLIKGEIKSFPPFDIDFGRLEITPGHTALEVEINEHVMFYVCCNASFTINDAVKFTVEREM